MSGRRYRLPLREVLPREMMALCLAALLASLLPARAEEAVLLEGGYALLNKPARVLASAVLIPGGSGYLGIGPDARFSGLAGNQLVRTRAAYAGQGIATLVVDAGTSVPAAIAFLRRFGKPVAVVATSRGSLRVPGALSGGPDGIVLTSAFLGDVQSGIGSAAALPPTLVVEHRDDHCRFTSPAGVEPFATWGGSRVGVLWMTGGVDRGDPCEAAGHHGFAGQDGQVVAAIARFAKTPR